MHLCIRAHITLVVRTTSTICDSKLDLGISWLCLSLSLFLSSSLSLSLDFLRNVTWKIRTSELFYYYYLFNNFIIIFYYFGRLMCGNKYRLWVFTLFREYKYTRKRFNHWNNSLVWFHFCYWIYKNMNLHEHGLIIILWMFIQNCAECAYDMQKCAKCLKIRFQFSSYVCKDINLHKHPQ